MTIEQVLASRGLLDALTARGHRLVGACPVHGGDNRTAFVVDTRRGWWRCFTGCDGGGDIVELVRRLDGCGYRQAAQVLAAIAGDAPDIQRAPPPRSPVLPAPFAPYRTRLALDPRHPFLAARGIRVETAADYEVGAWPGRGMLAGCIGVRLHAPDGAPIGYAGRRLQPGDRGKWGFPPRLPKSTLLYGLHRLRAATQVVVVEGPWEVLRLAQLGAPAVALLGTNLSLHQERLLSRWPRLVVLLDGDPAGRDATRRIAARLQATPILLAGGRDPADLDDDELRSLLPF